MASVSNDPNGLKRVFFKGLDGKRHPIRLGKCSEKDADNVAKHVEEIINSAVLDRPLARLTAEWLGRMPPTMEKKLVNVGLILPREATVRITLAKFLADYKNRRDDVKAATQTVYRHTSATC